MTLLRADGTVVDVGRTQASIVMPVLRGMAGVLVFLLYPVVKTDRLRAKRFAGQLERRLP